MSEIFANRCAVANCASDEWEVLVFRGSANRCWMIGYCELHSETETPEPPAGFELYGGGGDPQVVREVFGDPEHWL